MLSRSSTVKVCSLNHISEGFKGQIPAGACSENENQHVVTETRPSEARAKRLLLCWDKK